MNAPMLQPAPLHADIARGPEGGTAYWLHTRDGLQLRAGLWPAADTSATETPKGTVLLFPGRTEYVEKYGDTAAFLASQGYATFTIDWRGQGLADRLLDNPLLGHIDHFQKYQHDVDAMIEAATRLDLPKPWYLLAHSMGGAIGLRALYEDLPVKAAAFSAPMWDIGLAKPLRPLAFGIGAFSNLLGFGQHLAPSTSIKPYVNLQGFTGNLLTNDRDMYQMLRDHLDAVPKLALSGPTINWVYESLRECRELARRPAPKVPGFCTLGRQEDIVSTQAIHNRMDSWPNGELRVIDKVRHEVLMENPDLRHGVLTDICAFFQKHR